MGIKKVQNAVSPPLYFFKPDLKKNKKDPKKRSKVGNFPLAYQHENLDKVIMMLEYCTFNCCYQELSMKMIA